MVINARPTNPLVYAKETRLVRQGTIMQATRLTELFNLKMPIMSAGMAASRAQSS